MDDLCKVASEFTKKGKQVYVVGYCYGGRLTSELATRADTPFSGLAEAHGTVTIDQVKSLKKPMLYCCASNDWSFPEKLIDETEKVLKEKYPTNLHKVIRYPNTYHGFAIRGDDTHSEIAKQKDKCMHDVADFFNSH